LNVLNQCSNKKHKAERKQSSLRFFNPFLLKNSTQSILRSNHLHKTICSRKSVYKTMFDNTSDKSISGILHCNKIGISIFISDFVMFDSPQNDSQPQCPYWKQNNSISQVDYGKCDAHSWR